MVGWVGLLGNALWICGLAVCLACFSMARFQARAREERLRHRLEASEYSITLLLGLTLFCTGMLLTSGTWWEKGIWGLGVCLLLVSVARRLGGLGADGREGA